MAFSGDESTSSIYTALPDARTHIRLLHVDPADNEASISGHIKVVPLSDNARYTALSYTWGDAHNSRDILIDDRSVTVRYGCFYALTQLRHFSKGQSKLYWIDAICINQDDLKEKALQVQMMSSIYANATEVFVSLGAHADDSEMLFQLLNEIPERSYHQFISPLHYLPQLGNKGGNALLSRARLALQYLEDRPYWRRLWIVQEFLLARQVLIMCGFSIVQWEALHTLLRSLYHCLPTPLIIPFEDETEKSLSRSHETFDMWTILKIRNSGTFDKKYYGLNEGLQCFGHYGCLNTVDHIYGLLGLIDIAHSDGKPLMVDYSISPFDLAWKSIPLLQNYSTLVDGINWLLRALALTPSHSQIQRLITQRRLPLPDLSQSNLTKAHQMKQEKADPFFLLQVNDRDISRVIRADSGELCCRMISVIHGMESKQAAHKELQAVQDLVESSIRLKFIVNGDRYMGFTCPEIQDGDYIVAVNIGGNDRHHRTFVVVRWHEGAVHHLIGHGMFKAWGSFHTAECRMRKTRSGPWADSSTLTVHWDYSDLIALAAPLTTIPRPADPIDSVALSIEMYVDRLSTRLTVNDKSFATSIRSGMDLLENCDCSESLEWYPIA